MARILAGKSPVGIVLEAREGVCDALLLAWKNKVFTFVIDDFNGTLS